MIFYRFLSPEQLEGTFEQAKPYLPDSLRNLKEFIALYLSKDSMFFEVGDYLGAFWLTRIVPGWKADVHITLWDDKARDQHIAAKAFLKELMFKLKLRRINAYIPQHLEPALKYALRLGFHQEGVIHYGDYYDGDLRDVYMLGLYEEDLNGI